MKIRIAVVMTVFAALCAGAQVQPDVQFWRVLSGQAGQLISVDPDGNLVWSNSAPGQLDLVQRAGTLEPGNWEDYIGVYSTSGVQSCRVFDPDYLVIDLSGGPSATNYPLLYMASAPAGGWTDEHKTGLLVLRRIPSGSFTMGSPEEEIGHVSAEALHQVTLTKSFYIGVFEVTQKQWERVMGNYPSHFTNAVYRDTRPVEKVSYYDIREQPDNSDDPAVSWPGNSAVNANSFIGLLRAKTGALTLDLPTEAQWEYACRAGTATALNSGKNLTNELSDAGMDEVGRCFYNHPGGYSNNRNVSVDGGTAAAGSYLPNAWGLYDMHGNVYEWCLDWFAPYTDPVVDPVGAENPDVYGSLRMLRSGCWDQDAQFSRSANRRNYTPGSRYNICGLRVVMTIP